MSIGRNTCDPWYPKIKGFEVVESSLFSECDQESTWDDFCIKNLIVTYSNLKARTCYNLQNISTSKTIKIYKWEKFIPRQASTWSGMFLETANAAMLPTGSMTPWGYWGVDATSWKLCIVIADNTQVKLISSWLSYQSYSLCEITFLIVNSCYKWQPILHFTTCNNSNSFHQKKSLFWKPNKNKIYSNSILNISLWCHYCGKGSFE